MSGLCQYRYALGVPSQGVHAARVAGLALWDIVGTLIGAIIIGIVWALWHDVSIMWSVFGAAILLFVLGEVLHCMFCVPTPVTQALGCVSVSKQ